MTAEEMRVEILDLIQGFDGKELAELGRKADPGYKWTYLNNKVKLKILTERVEVLYSRFNQGEANNLQKLREQALNVANKAA